MNNTKKKKSNKKTLKYTVKKGGFLINHNGKQRASSIEGNKQKYERLLIDTIKNSKLELISESSLHGLIFLATIQSHEKCYFKDAEGNPIMKYIIKGSFISRQRKAIRNDKLHIRKETMNPEEFLNEIKIQREIYVQSLGTFYTNIVPDIQMISESTTVDLKTPKIFLDTLEDKEQRDRVKIYFDLAKKQGIGSFNIFVMKYTDNYYTYQDIVTKINRITTHKIKQNLLLKLKNIYIVYHVLLGLLGYVHTDAHGKNIMIYYDKDNPDSSLDLCKAYLIDFGRIKKIVVGDFDLDVFVPKFNQNEVDFDTYGLRLIIQDIIGEINENCDIVRKQRDIIRDEWGCIKIIDYTRLLSDDKDFDSSYFNILFNIIINKLKYFNTLKSKIKNKEKYHTGLQKYAQL